MFDRLFRRTPSSFQVQLQPAGRSVTASSDESILQAFLREGLPFPHNCRVGGCGECKCKLVSGKVKELTDKSYLLSAEELQQGYILACQSRPKTDVVVEAQLVAADAALQATEGRIVSLKPLTGDIVHLVMDLDTVLPYRAGQYANLVVPPEAGGQPGEVRAFSFASAPDPAQPQRVDFFIRHVPGGRFTTWLNALGQAGQGVGQRLGVQGPVGRFGLGQVTGPMVCVAGGSGLAPIVAMLQQAVADGQCQQALTLVFGARTQADLYARDLIDGIRQHWRGPFQCVFALASEPSDSDWSGARGTASEVLTNLLPQVAHLASGAQAWLCGPPGMIDACTTVLSQAGVPAAQIHQDKFLDASMTAAAVATAAAA